MSAQAGRASYVHVSQLTQPDPGAKAVLIWLEAILYALTWNKLFVCVSYQIDYVILILFYMIC